MSLEKQHKSRQERLEKIAMVDALVREGFPVGVACKKASVPYSTYKSWGGSGKKKKNPAAATAGQCDLVALDTRNHVEDTTPGAEGRGERQTGA